MPSLPKVVLVGGPDVDSRLELMRCLSTAFNMSALGSQSSLHARFLAAGFEYRTYHLNRQVNPLADLLTLGQLVSVFRRLKPQIVHTFDAKPGVWGRLAARWAGVPIVIGTLPGLGALYAHDGITLRLIRLIYEPLQKTASRLADLTIFQNHDDLHQFIAANIVSEEKAMVIPGSGVSTDLFAPSRVSDAEKMQLRSELGIKSDAIVVTMVSRVIRSKGVLEFMAAALRLGARYPKVHFLLVGPADEESIDRLDSTELAQLKQAITWPGLRRDIPAVLAMSSIFVLPSAFREGIPRVLLEAASMGLPIITTNSPGCNEVVEDGVNGFFVPTHNPEALSEAISRLVEQPELRQRFGHASRQRAVERFDLSIIAGQTHKVYRQLLAPKALLPAIEVQRTSDNVSL